MDANNASKVRRSFSWISCSQSYRRLFNRNRVGHFDASDKATSHQSGLKRCEAVWNIHGAAVDHSYQVSGDLSPVQVLPSLSSIPSTSSFLPDDNNYTAVAARGSNISSDSSSMPVTPATPNQCAPSLETWYKSQHSNHVQVKLESNEQTDNVIFIKELPPLPVRSATMPVCKATTDSVEDEKAMDTKESKINRISRVATWLGQPFNKIINHAAKIRPLTQTEFSDQDSESDSTSFFGCTPSNLNMHGDHSTANHLVYQQESRFSSTVIKSTDFQRTRTLHCKVPLIINQGNCRPFEYELHLQKNGVTIQMFKGKMDKLGKIASVDHTSNIEFNIDMQDDQLDLTFVLTGRAMKTTSIEKGFAWIQSACAKDKVVPQPFRFPVIGYLHLTGAENLESFVAQASKLYTLTQPLCNRPPNSELKMQLYFEVEENVPKCEFMPSLSECDKDFAVRHCQMGDYITVHVRGKPGAPAKWIRYWAAVRNQRIWLHDFDQKSKKLIASIPLQPLVGASKPSDEDVEKICLCRKTGVVLRFNRDYAKVQEPTILDENESFEAKMFMLTDNVESTRCWLKAMRTIASETQSPACERASFSKYSEDGVNLRYLW